MSYMLEQAEPTSDIHAEYGRALGEACNNGLVWDCLGDYLLDVEDKEKMEEILALFKEYEKAPYSKKKIRRRLEELVSFDEVYMVDEAQVHQMDLNDLYDLRRSLLSGDYRGLDGRLKAIAENLRIKGQVVKTVSEIGFKIRHAANIQEATDIHAEIAQKGVHDLQTKHGLDVQIDYNGCDLEELNAEPHIYWFNHQGGGLETMMVASLFKPEGKSGRPNSILLKSELKKIPLMGTILDKLGSIYIDRSKLNKEESRKEEMDAISKQMAESLADGRGLILYPEGTRSNDGNIAGSPARVKWAQDLKETVDQAMAGKKVPQVLVIVDTLLAFPTTVESMNNVFSDKMRKNAGVKIKFFRLPDDLPFEENPNDACDENNFFGFARQRLTEIQRAEILKLLK
jgi:1-acyl-sn-glycerol-3-phosphate acyltransferase